LSGGGERADVTATLVGVVAVVFIPMVLSPLGGFSIADLLMVAILWAVRNRLRTG